LLGEVTARYDAMFGEPMPYMMSFQAGPRGNETFQFTVQFYPLHRDKGRVKYLAGVEQATGVFTVDVDPKLAAKMMREAL
jgi:UDPglucose--hexose-1-phosphate uridylyltransferase